MTHIKYQMKNQSKYMHKQYINTSNMREQYNKKPTSFLFPQQLYLHINIVKQLNKEFKKLTVKKSRNKEH